MIREASSAQRIAEEANRMARFHLGGSSAQAIAEYTQREQRRALEQTGIASEVDRLRGEAGLLASLSSITRASSEITRRIERQPKDLPVHDARQRLERPRLATNF